jgi:hypothetical protein
MDGVQPVIPQFRVRLFDLDILSASENPTFQWQLKHVPNHVVCCCMNGNLELRHATSRANTYLAS